MRNLWLQIKNFFRNLWYGIRSLRFFRTSQIPQILESFSRRELFTLLATVAIIVIAGGVLIYQSILNQGPGPHYGGELVEGLVGQPQFINPILSLNSSVDTDLSKVVYAQILKFDINQNLTPDLAAAIPTVDKDQKTYTLHLKSNLKWQDNKPLTADDVVFTIETIQNPEFESPLRPNWARVKVTKVDDQTLTFVLPEVSASFMSNFAIGIIPKHIWSDLNPRNFRLTDQNLKPVGSGPYTVKEIRKTADGTIKSLSMHANSNYYDGQPYISTLTFRFYDDAQSLINAYQGKEIQSLGYVPFDKNAFLAPNDKMNQYRVNLPQYEAVFFNLPKSSILADKSVRQALWLSVNRDDVINDVYNGNAAPAFGPILPDTLGYDTSIEKSAHFSIDEATTILDKGGWVLDPTTKIRANAKLKKSLEFNLALNGSVVLNVKTAQILQDEWAKIGAKVNLIVVGPNELESQYIRPRSFDALLFSENVGADPDPFPFWSGTQTHDPGLNLSGFTNAEADKLLTEARRTTDENIRTKDYQRFQQIINDQLPAIFLVRSLYIYNVPKKVAGIDLQNIVEPSDRFSDINHWYFQK